MVEYEGIEWLDSPLEYFPKINIKDNTITIKKAKNSWSKEETVTLVLKMQHDYTKYKESCHFGPNLREIAEWTDNWLEQNI